MPLPEFESRTLQQVALDYADYTIPAPRRLTGAKLTLQASRQQQKMFVRNNNEPILTRESHILLHSSLVTVTSTAVKLGSKFLNVLSHNKESTEWH